MAKRNGHNQTQLTEGDRALNMAEQILAMKKSGKALDQNALFNVAMNNTDGNTQELLRHAKEGLVDGKVDLQGLMGLAGQNIEGNDGLAGLLKEMGGVNLNGVDTDKIAHVPGMVVDKETGDVNFLGILPVPPQYAKLLTAGYSYLLTQINGEIGTRAFDMGAKLEGASLPAFAKGRMGWAAALGAMGLTTFWADANSLIQTEKDYGKVTAKLANQLAPVLQQIKGRQGVAALFSVGQGENEVIFNARRKMQREQHAARQSVAVEALGRSVALVASLGTVQAHAAGAEVATMAATDGGFAAKDAKVNARVKEIREASSGELSWDKAQEQALGELGYAAHKIGDQVNSGFGGLFSNPQQMKNLGVVLAQQVADGLADKWYNQSLKDVQKVSALDMILELRKQLDKNPRGDRFKLPDGMRLEGGKGYDAQHLPLADYIVQIFQQHERDCAGAEGIIPERLNKELLGACEAMAKELRSGHLDGLALIRLVGERVIVKEGGRMIASSDQVKAALDGLKMTMRHVEWVDPKAYAANANFTLKDVKASWDAAASDEKRLLVALIPDQVLDAAGVKMEAVKSFKAQNVNEYNEQIAHLNHALHAQGAKFLQEQAGLTHQETDQIALLEQHVQREGVEAVEDVLPGAGQKSDITRPLANAVVSLAHQGKLAEVVGRHAGA